MMLSLFYDTETSGLPLFDQPSEDPRQPHIVQLAAVLATEDRKPVASINLIAIPDGWEIPGEVAAIHGITTDLARQRGVPEAMIIDMLMHLARAAELRVAHNESFDARIVRIGLMRFKTEAVADQWKERKSFCTMKAATPLVNMPPTDKMVAAGFVKPKPPKLEECIKHFFGEELKGAHDALTDVKACMRGYWHLQGLAAAKPAEAVA